LCLSARALVKLERFDEANDRIDRAMSIYPEFALPYDVRGDLFYAKGELQRSAESFQRALELDPKLQRTRMKLGQVFMHLGRVEEARALKTEFMEFSEDNEDIAKAAELEDEEEYAEAEKLYRQILIRNPDNVSAMRLWAKLGMQEKRFADAEVLLQQAVDVAPGFGQALTDLCQAQFEQEKYEDVVDSAKKLIKLRPSAPDGQIWLGAATAAAGSHIDAIKCFEKALEIAPNHVGAMCGKGNACRTSGDQDGAMQHQSEPSARRGLLEPGEPEDFPFRGRGD